MSIQLYDHNQKAYDAVASMLAETNKVAVVHPTGTGKSFIAFKLCEENPSKKVLWLSPSEYIFKTQVENLKATGADVPQNIQYMTYARLMRMNESEMTEFHPDIVILDEMHRAGSPRWGESVKSLLSLNPNTLVLGLSATAIRYLDNQRDMSEELFDGNVASEITLGDAIVRGILNPPKYVLSVFSYQKDLEHYQNRVRRAKNRAVQDVAKQYLEALRRALEKADGLDVIFDKHMTDRTGKYIIFCANKNHMDQMMELCSEWFSRVDATPHVYSVYSDDPSSSQSFADFKTDNDNTHLRLLYCIDALNEGIHVEDVSGVILLRPTVSPIIYKQQIGRALSASKSKEPVIFDIVMNIENLFSIDSVKEEMQEALAYYMEYGRGDEIVNQQFSIIDQIQDCRKLFEKLNDTLTASWDMMYSCAKQYFEAYGNLNVPKNYKTKEGYSLGHWIATQRRIYHGQIYGSLSQSRINKLNAIGMEWNFISERSWNQNYEAAKTYFEVNGNLRVPANYVTDSGIRLGAWINNLRSYRKSLISSNYLTEERIAELDKIGMVWNFSDYRWERNYNAAVQYFQKHGNLNASAYFVSEDGVQLGVWLRRLRSDKKNGTLSLTEEQIKKLDDLGMVWDKTFTRKWKNGFDVAKSYFEQNGDLNVPCNYVSKDGFALGKWISNQRNKYIDGKLNSERVSQLDAIGMVWQKNDSWEIRFELAKAYFNDHGNLVVPKNYTVEGINLSKWVNEQKQIYRGNRPGQKLTDFQIIRLESIGIDWRNPKDAIWENRYKAVKDYFDKHGDIEIPNDEVLSDGRTIGSWILVQRKNYKDGKLTAEQVAKLNAINMVWELGNSWEVGFSHAKEYFAEYGNLLISKDFICSDGYALGNWIINQRSKYNSKAMSVEQVKRLDSIEMVWSASEYQWNCVYKLAENYFCLHGNIDMPTNYKAEDGTNLWKWLRTQREKYRKGELTNNQISQLEKIKMNWSFPTECDWENYYAKAEKFYQQHGNLNVPVTYRTDDGLWLGRWVQRQRKDKSSLKTTGMNGNQVMRLEQVGMVWEMQAV